MYNDVSIRYTHTYIYTYVYIDITWSIRRVRGVKWWSSVMISHIQRLSIGNPNAISWHDQTNRGIIWSNNVFEESGGYQPTIIWWPLVVFFKSDDIDFSFCLGDSTTMMCISNWIVGSRPVDIQIIYHPVNVFHRCGFNPFLDDFPEGPCGFSCFFSCVSFLLSFFHVFFSLFPCFFLDIIMVSPHLVTRVPRLALTLLEGRCPKNRRTLCGRWE